MSKIPMRSVVLAALAAFAFNASGQEKNPGRTQVVPNQYDQYKQKKLADLDANNDGAVSAEEYLASKRSLWSSLAKGDKMTVEDCSKSHGDGEKEPISTNARSWPDILKKLCSKLDKNGDGQLNWEEFAAAKWGSFKNLDKNGDGKLDTEELASQPTMRKSGRAAMESAKVSADSGQAGSKNPMATVRSPNEEHKVMIQKDLAASNAKVIKPRTAQEVADSFQARVEMLRNGQNPASTTPRAGDAAQASLTQQRLTAGKTTPGQVQQSAQTTGAALPSWQAEPVEAKKEPTIYEKVQGWFR